MRIKTQFTVTMLIFGMVLAAASASAIITNQQAGEATEQEAITNRIAQGANDLSYLTNDYLVFRESQQLSRWQSRFASFSSDVDALQVDKPDQQALARNILATQQRMKEVFEGVASAVANASLAPNQTLEPSFLQVSWSRMAVQSQGLTSDASRLSQLLRNQVDETRHANMIVVLAMMGVFGAYFVANYMIVRRRLLKSIASVQAGTLVIGSGNLDFIIDEQRKDEIGDLSRAFNRMTASLKGVTASKTELEREIADRKMAEHSANQQKAIQEGINRILEASLQSTTEEDLGRSCLEVAEALTGSEYGFIGEIGPDGFLHDVAISHLGWEVCETFDKTGHRRPPADFKIHGIYGRVLHDGKGFFANDPVSHPDTIGVPEGHPPLKVFLGVPLVHDGRPVGMVALANKEGGYEAKDLESLETLAPSIVQAFARKRAERALMRRTAELEASNSELESFSYSVSHDLRAPLRHIDGFSKALLEDYADKLDPQGKHFLEAVRGGSQRMGQLIDDLLKLSRVTRSDLHIDMVDLSQTAELIGTALRQEQPDRQIDLSICPGLVAQGDARLLRVAMENLLGNAWKFTSKREQARIEFGLWQSGDGPAYYVRDNGAGFDQSYAEKLFAPFQRLHREDDFPGTGIGLATVQRIVQRHGGRVWAEGQVDSGATVYFTLR